MLISFNITNYRSIKEKQTLSMVASTPDDGKVTHNTPFRAAPHLLSSSGIYGANGSGKSNIIRALDFFQDFVRDSSKERTRGDEITEITPFLFDGVTQQQPTTIEISFIHKGYLFDYGFSVDTQQVHDEWLYATPQDSVRQRPQKWFERNDPEPFGKMLKGRKSDLLEQTRSNALLLSTAVQKNHERLSIPFDWIVKGLRMLTTPSELSPVFTIKQAKEGKKEEISTFMRSLDLAFHDFECEDKTITMDNLVLPKDMPDPVKQEIIKKLVGTPHVEVKTLHLMTDGASIGKLDFEEESDGTKNLFALSAPLLDVLEHGYTLIADELERSLHPHAMQVIIDMFHNPAINKHGAQLLFTTHNTHAMNYLGSDRIWLLERGAYGETQAVALSEFKGERSTSSLEKRYLSGRYGGIPHITTHKRGDNGE